jgi:hypothetical protein
LLITKTFCERSSVFFLELQFFSVVAAFYWHLKLSNRIISFHSESPTRELAQVVSKDIENSKRTTNDYNPSPQTTRHIHAATSPTKKTSPDIKMSCSTPSQIPSPPTTLSSCAIPIGGSNSSILDVCCNGHINAMATYSSPGSSSNARADDGCFQFCVTDTPEYVAGCLTNTLGEFEKGGLMFECFNVPGTKKGRDGGDVYMNAAGRVGMGWVMGLVVGLGAVGAVLGSV